MKYWFIVQGSLPQEVGLALYEKIRPYGANLTELVYKTYIYGDADEEWVEYAIENELVQRGIKFERG